MERQKYNAGLLKDTRTREEFKLDFATKFEVLQELQESESDVNNQRLNNKGKLTYICEEVVGSGKSRRKTRSQQKPCAGS